MPKKRRTWSWSGNVNDHPIHSQYAEVLVKVNGGMKIREALKSLGMAKSTFYKWKPLAELKILDPSILYTLQETYKDIYSILGACRNVFNETNLILKARELNSLGKLVSDF